MVMKANRLSERPQAPTWEKTQEDVAGADPDDVVFSMGKDYLPHLSGSLTKASESGSGNVSTTDSDCDTSQIDASKVEASYANVTRLIALNKEFENVPKNLVEQYDKLKLMGEDMTKSVKELKEMALSIPEFLPQTKEDQSHPSSGHKSKQKKKK